MKYKNIKKMLSTLAFAMFPLVIGCKANDVFSILGVGNSDSPRVAQLELTASFNRGVLSTNQTSIQVDLTSTGRDLPQQVCVVESVDCSVCVYQEFASSLNFSLSSGEGEKVISYKAKKDSIETSCQSVTVILDTSAPVTNSSSIQVESGANLTNRQTVEVGLSISDVYSSSSQQQVCLQEGASCAGCSWVAMASSKNLTFANLTNETKTVSAKFKDLAGNESGCVSDSITLDTVAPTGASVAINSGASTTTSSVVSLALNAADAVSSAGNLQMCLSKSASCSGCTVWQTYSTTYPGYSLDSANGTKYVSVKFRDQAQNETSCVTSSILLDNDGPTGTIAIAGGVAGTSTSSVTVNLVGADAGVGGIEMCVQNGSSCTGCSSFEAFSATKAITLPAGDGTKYVAARFRDSLGNQSSCLIDSILLDSTSPSGVSIATVLTVTSSSTVPFTVNATDVSTPMQMCVGQSADCSSCSYETYSYLKSVALTGGTGVKTVSAKVKDSVGNESSCVNTTVTIDQSGPSSLSFSIQSGAVGTSSQSVSLSMSATEDYSAPMTMCIQESATCAGCSAYVSYSTGQTFTLTAGDGTKTVSAIFKDNLGNTSSCISDSIVLDTAGPTLTSVTIDAGAASTTSQSVTLALAATESVSNPMEMCIQEGATCAGCSSWESYATSKSFTLSNGGGTKQVSAIFRDALTNNSACVTDSILYQQDLMVEARYAAADDWNKYVKASDTLQVCNPNVDLTIESCIHGGEYRKVVTTLNSCANLSMTDGNNFFDWTCAVESSLAVFTGHLKTTRGLRDLIDAAGWRTNYVTLNNNGTLTNGPSTAWWNNTVTALPNSTSGVQSLSTAGAIYFQSGDASVRGYNIAADRIGIVTLSNAALNWDNSGSANCSDDAELGSSQKCVIASGSHNFLWIETNLDLATTSSANRGIALGFVGHSRIFKSKVINAGSYALYLNGVVASRILSSNFHGLGGAYVDGSSQNFFETNRFMGKVSATNNGVTILGLSENNRFQNTNVSNFSSLAVLIKHQAIHNVFVNTLLSSNSSGIKVGETSTSATHGNTFVNTTIGLTLMKPIELTENANSSVIHNVAIIGGQSVSLNNSTYRNTISNMGIRTVSTSEGSRKWSNFNSTLHNKLTGAILEYGAIISPYCTVSGGTNPGVNSSDCLAEGASNYSGTSHVEMANSYVRAITSGGDVLNSNEDASGQATYSGMTDYFSFDNFYRNWGVYSGDTFPTNNFNGTCTGGACQLYDWSLSSSDTTLRNKSGDGATTEGSFTVGASCPSTLGVTLLSTAATCGTDVNATSSGSCASGYWYASQTYLSNAAEILGDGNGDEDGLCESGETCLYSPNFGAYQGHDGWGTCTGLAGYTIYGYGTNGR